MMKSKCKVKMTLVNSILNFEFIVICTVNSEQILLSIEKQGSVELFSLWVCEHCPHWQQNVRDKLQHKLNQRANIASA